MSRQAGGSVGAHGLVWALFVLSGATGLVYEVLWSRMLTVVFGSSTSATAAVVAALMGGFALGSFLAARWVDRVPRLLRAYGLVEGLLGCWCLALPDVVRTVTPALAVAYRDGTAPLAFGVVRLGLVLLVLLGPATLMGATFPLLGAWVVRAGEQPGRWLAFMYGGNCLGAVLGALSSSFVLVPLLGLRGATTAAAGASLLVAAAAVALDRAPGAAPTGTPAPGAARATSAPEPRARVLALVLGVTGAASMVCQVAWTRSLSLLLGSSVYSFSVILAVFIGGLALGGLVLAPRLERWARGDRRFAVLVAAAGVAGLAVTAALGSAPEAVTWADGWFQGAFALRCAGHFAATASLVLVPATLMGVLLPLACAEASRGRSDPGRALGVCYGANSLGCVLGSLVAGFVLAPAVGLRATLLVAAGLYLASAAWLWARAAASRADRCARAAAAVAAVAALMAAVPAWDMQLMASAPYLHAARYAEAAARTGCDVAQAMRAAGEVVFEREDATGVVTVRRCSDGALALQVNGKTDASTRVDMVTQCLLAHVPLLCAKSPRDVLVIGLGSGATLGACQAHDVRAVDCVELSPAVVEAAGLFASATGHDLADPRLRLLVEDARTHVALTSRTYDVVISEPSNPWIAGMTNLFTREFFASCRERLAGDGVMCQWLQAYGMGEGDFRSVLRTFQGVFPHTQLWAVEGCNDYLLLGYAGAGPAALAEVERRRARPAVQASLRAIGLTSTAALFESFVAGPAFVAELARGGSTVTDDNLALEYSAPRYLRRDRALSLPGSLPAAARLAALRREFPSADRTGLAERLGQRLAATGLCSRASELLAGRRPGEAEALLEQALALAPDDEELRLAASHLFVALGQQLFAARRLAEAESALARAVALDPRNADAHNDLGTCLAALGDREEALRAYDTALVLRPDHLAALTNFGAEASAQGLVDEAAAAFERLVAAGAGTAAIHNNLAVLCVKRERWDDAARHWRRALELEPTCQAARVNLGRLREAGVGQG